MFPLNLNFQTRFNLKKLLDTIEDYTNHLVDETEQLLNIVKQGVARKEDSLFASSSATIEIKSSETNNENRDLLSIFFSPEVKDLNKSIKSTSIVSAGSLDQDGSQSKDSADLESVPSPLFRVWEGMPQSDVPEHLEPDLETEILTSFKYRGPICTYLEANELPADLLGTSCWLMRYIGSVARILLAKVKEIETGLSIALLKDKPEMAPISLPVREASFKKRPTMRTGPSTVGLLDPYLSSSRQTSHRRSKASQRKTKESGLSGFGLDQMSDEEDEDADELEDEPEEDAKVEPEPDHKPATPTTTRDSPFSPPTEESSDQMEAFADLLRQLDVAENLSRIKPKEALTPIYLTQKTSQVIQRNNLLQLENTALEIFLSKQQVTVNFNLLACADEVQPTWGQLLNDMQFRVHPVDAEIKASVRDTGTVTPEASLDHGQTRSQSITSSFGDSDTIEQLTSSALPELTRYVYAPAREVIAFEPISSDHRYDVQPPHYRLMPIEEAVKRADERRDLKKRLIQAKKEIVRTFLKEIESESDSGADEDEEPAGWRKWFPYRRRAELVAEAVDRLVALEAALHSEAIKTLQELSARKRTIVKEIAEKIEDHKTLASLQETKDAPQKKKWLCQRRFSDVLYNVLNDSELYGRGELDLETYLWGDNLGMKPPRMSLHPAKGVDSAAEEAKLTILVLTRTMKTILADNMKKKALMLARQRTLSHEVAEMAKTVQRLAALEKKTDWGDLALQRMQYDTALRRNDVLDSDISELKNMNADYTLKLIHSREELDAKVWENRSILKNRDSSLKKKINHQTTFTDQHKKLAEVQEILRNAPKITDYNRYVNRMRTEAYKKEKMKQYKTELEVGQARKKVQYLQKRIEALSLEPSSLARLRERKRKEMDKRKKCLEWQTNQQTVAKRGFGYEIKKL